MSPWVIVSSWQEDGYLSAANTGNGTTVEIYPGEEPEARQDMELYGDCPGPMPEDFWAHGISLRPGDDGLHTLFVVRHGGRGAIEVFEVDGRGKTPSVTWIGCVLAPAGGPAAPAHDFNSVIWLPDGGLAVTRFAVDEVGSGTRAASGRRFPALRASARTVSRSPLMAGTSTSADGQPKRSIACRGRPPTSGTSSGSASTSTTSTSMTAAACSWPAKTRPHRRSSTAS